MQIPAIDLAFSSHRIIVSRFVPPLPSTTPANNTGYLAIPREGEFDFLSEAEATFVPPQPKKEKKPKRAPTPVKAITKMVESKKKFTAQRRP